MQLEALVYKALDVIQEQYEPTAGYGFDINEVPPTLEWEVDYSDGEITKEVTAHTTDTIPPTTEIWASAMTNTHERKELIVTLPDTANLEQTKEAILQGVTIASSWSNTDLSSPNYPSRELGYRYCQDYLYDARESVWDSLLPTIQAIRGKISGIFNNNL